MSGNSPAEQVLELAAWLAETDIEQLELRTAHSLIRLRRGGAAIAAAPTNGGDPPSKQAATQTITATSVGTFLHRHPLHDEPLASAGQSVRAGQIVGFLRIGPLLLPVAAPHDGVVVAVLAAHGALVGYGAALIDLG